MTSTAAEEWTDAIMLLRVRYRSDWYDSPRVWPEECWQQVDGRGRERVPGVEVAVVASRENGDATARDVVTAWCTERGVTVSLDTLDDLVHRLESWGGAL